ncbi:MAG TPA: hypothetical protein VLD58_06925 [Gemmatimonadales bacterium]|nr:hypothetical protein [Gemmatimonadales bacterium]HSB70057.1 hypothetical protein [Candidatus Methylomirabilis sp.]
MTIDRQVREREGVAFSLWRGGPVLFDLDGLLARRARVPAAA